MFGLLLSHRTSSLMLMAHFAFWLMPRYTMHIHFILVIPIHPVVHCWLYILTILKNNTNSTCWPRIKSHRLSSGFLENVEFFFWRSLDIGFRIIKLALAQENEKPLNENRKFVFLFFFFILFECEFWRDSVINLILIEM